MVTVNNIYPGIYNFENLLAAFYKARKNKLDKADVLKYQLNLEENLIDLQNHLIYKSYEQGRYKEFKIYEPKERMVLALPFRDRVAQHALMNVIDPIFEKGFVYDSYACRKNKGTVAGVIRLQKFLNKYDGGYFLKGDIKKYFYSIDHEVLKKLVRRKISCKNTLWLIDKIIDTTENPGLPIGNLTSQLFANIYLNELDKFCKHQLRAKHYMRYMDDFLILHKDKAYLKKCFAEIKEFLNVELRLQLNKKSYVENLSKGINFLGYRSWHYNRLMRKRNIKRNKKKFRKLMKLYKANLIEEEFIRCRYMSFLGHCKWANSKKVIKSINKILEIK